MPKIIRNLDDLPVVDAKRTITIVISHNDVQKGKTKNPTSCAAAKACLRQLGCTKVRVHLGRTYIRKGDHWERYITPKSVRSEIIAFDRGAQFAEGEYTFRAPKGREKLGSGLATGSNKGRNNPRASKKKRVYHYVSGVRPFFNAKQKEAAA